MTIDMHAHFLPPNVVQMMRKRDMPPRIERDSTGVDRIHRAQGMFKFNPVYSDIEGRIKLMDKTGVDTQILSLPGLMGLDSLPVEQSLPLLQANNNQLSDICKNHPYRFIGLTALPLADIDLAARELRRGIEELGLIGAILPINFFETPEIAQKLAPIFEVAQQLGTHFFIHPGWRPDESPSSSSALDPNPKWKGVMPTSTLDLHTQIARATITFLYSDFLNSYPDVTVQVANLGGSYPILVERMDQVSNLLDPGGTPLSKQVHNIYFDCASLGARAIEIAVGVYGADNIFFGSDTPTFSIEWSHTAIREARISDQDRQKILQDNAKKLLQRQSATKLR